MFQRIAMCINPPPHERRYAASHRPSILSVRKKLAIDFACDCPISGGQLFGADAQYDPLAGARTCAVPQVSAINLLRADGAGRSGSFSPEARRYDCAIVWHVTLPLEGSYDGFYRTPRVPHAAFA